jgi:hypothetical protein
MRKELTLIGLSLLLTGTAAAQTEVLTGVTHGKDYGVTYLLPATQLELTIHATKHVYTPGEFAKYAERYLRLTNVSPEPSTYWTLDKVQTEVTGVPDKEHVYFVKMKDKTVAPLIELTKDGIVRSINVPISSGAQKSATPAPTPASPNTATEAIDPRSFLTEEILMASSTAKMAELVAKEIYNIRESKNALLRGEADNTPQDGAQLKLMLDNLNKQETALTEMFTGRESEESLSKEIQLIPKEVNKEVVFRFSRKLGIVDKDDLAGAPVYLTLTNLKSITIPPAPDPKKALDGVAYNVPGRARVTLSYNDQKLLTTEISVTQFGTVEYLASILFNKNATIKVTFNPVTGGLLKVDRGE